MTSVTPPAPADEPSLEHRLALRADRYGLIGLGGSSVLLVAVGAGWVTGPLATLALVVLLGVIVALIGIAILGGPEARRVLAPYGLLKPGTLWLALFYLAPLWTLLRISLSTKESRFSIDYQFTWAFSNYQEAFTEFGAQFTRAFLYSGIATVVTIAIGYPLAYVIAFRGASTRTACSAWSSCRSSRAISSEPSPGSPSWPTTASSSARSSACTSSACSKRCTSWTTGGCSTPPRR